MKKSLFVGLTLIALLLSACSVTINNPGHIKGSGKVISETRTASGFDAVELEGSADVIVSFGAADSVVVEADDNIVPLIETNVRSGKLVISTKNNQSFSTNNPVRVTVTMKSMQSAGISGAGNITISDLSGDEVGIDLSGSGNITAAGTANAVNVSLGGSGNIHLDSLQAKSARVKIGGSGNVEVFASNSLDANISGSGNVTYSGSPADISKTVTGAGSIQSK